MNIIEVFKKYPSQADCIRHLEKARWPNKPICTYCGSDKTTKRNSDFRHQCNACNKSFSVTVGTILHDTRMPLQKWFLAISLVLNAKKGISSRQLARDLDLPVKTAWSVAHRIRKAMNDDGAFLAGVVEMDETYIGGKPRKPNDLTSIPAGGDKSKRGRGTDKTPVVGLVERRGKVVALSVNKSQLSAADLQGLVRKRVKLSGSLLITDDYKGYNGMSHIVQHQTINHQKAFVSEGDIHTNTIEGFWSLLKRGIIGQYHKVSDKYLDRYLDEFCYRYNGRSEGPDVLFEDTLAKMLT